MLIIEIIAEIYKKYLVNKIAKLGEIILENTDSVKKLDINIKIKLIANR